MYVGFKLMLIFYENTFSGCKLYSKVMLVYLMIRNIIHLKLKKAIFPILTRFFNISINVCTNVWQHNSGSCFNIRKIMWT